MTHGDEQSVSAVIAAFNSERFIGDAIESVLAQTHSPLECIVVDDGSTDQTAAIATAFGERISTISQANAGVAAARNRGAEAARGQFLAFLDADDTWHSRRLERQLGAMRGARAEAGLCASRVIGEKAPMGRYMRMRPAPTTLDSLLLWRGTVVPASSNLVVRRTTFHELGGYDVGFRLVSDWDLLLRLVARESLVYLDEPLVQYRWHTGNDTRDLMGIERELERAYTLAFARHGDHITISRRRADGGRHRMLAAAHLRLRHPRQGLTHLASATVRDPTAIPSMTLSVLRRT